MNDEMIEDLTLLLAFFTTVHEDSRVKGEVRAWKTYSFDVLDSLAEQGLIRDSHGAKSFAFTEKGLARVSEVVLKLADLLDLKTAAEAGEGENEEDFPFDGCEVCRKQKKAMDEGRMLNERELRNAFDRARREGGAT